jgi:hypothetical protein
MKQHNERLLGDCLLKHSVIILSYPLNIEILKACYLSSTKGLNNTNHVVKYTIEEKHSVVIKRIDVI